MSDSDPLRGDPESSEVRSATRIARLLFPASCICVPGDPDPWECPVHGDGYHRTNLIGGAS